MDAPGGSQLGGALWARRAYLAEQAVNRRHAKKLWWLPRTNLAVTGWPTTFKEGLFFPWHYWWQAHYLDCLIDAVERERSKARRRRLRQTIRAVTVRNLRGLERNSYFDDRAWLALALRRAADVGVSIAPKRLQSLEGSILAGIDGDLPAVPWNRRDPFYNVPTNGPAAILFARTGHVAEAIAINDWMFSNLLTEQGLLADGLRLTVSGPVIEPREYTYCQGVALGANLEIIKALQTSAAGAKATVLEAGGKESSEDLMRALTRLRSLVKAIATHQSDHHGVITADNGDGDGGLFKGILARYLASVAVELPQTSPLNRATSKLAARLVLRSAESMWGHRLEVDGLPVFPSNWAEDAHLPHNYGLNHGSVVDKLGMVNISERDLSVQLSGWLLLEAAARIERETPFA